MNISPKFLIVLIIFTLLNIPYTQAQTLYLQIFPSSINFPDANPDLTPLIQAGEQVTLELEISETNTNWLLTILSQGDLQSETKTIPIENVSWRVSPSPPFLHGTLNKVQPQLLGRGKGLVKITAQIDFFLQNKWEYSPGTYNQIIMFTLIAP